MSYTIMKKNAAMPWIRILVAVWYLVGVIGFCIDPLKPYFKSLSPVGMFVAAALLLYFHEPRNLKSYLILAGIAGFGFVIEVIGVNTQLIFGHYIYGKSLGPTFFNTPLAIGFNWLILIYGIAALAKPIRNTWYFPLAGASVMAAFDWIMEPVAIANNMWTWAFVNVPIKNYIDWFLISGFIFLMIRILKLEINNPIAGFLFIMQVAFFALLNVLTHI